MTPKKTYSQPTTLGMAKSFGFGDRLGLAGLGHIEAVKNTGFSPILAQQSIRELTRTGRTPDEVMLAAQSAVRQTGWTGTWGADADHLQTKDDVFLMAANGFTFFTIDPSAHVNKDADTLNVETLSCAYKEMVSLKKIESERCFDLYQDRSFQINDDFIITFSDRTELMRAEVKYGAAIAHTKKMSEWISEACADKPFEIEMSVDETYSPTSAMEHLFIGLELKRAGVKVISLAPRFVGEFEKGIDYKGDIKRFEKEYRKHAAIAEYCGPYKISIHSGSDKFSVYPIISEISGSALHVKTAGTSYLEALRVISRTDKTLIRKIIEFCRRFYERDKATYSVSATLSGADANPSDSDLEHEYLDKDDGRQIFHVTFGSVLSGGRDCNGALFKDLILENLQNNSDLHCELLAAHLGKHLKLLGG
ncbi:MAG: hypothetical protein GX811_03455 [Lentisphaerae bacterium]|nr:hypothetical protein [Lentisphaerota bacterium]